MENMNLCPKCGQKLHIDKILGIIHIICPNCGVKSDLPENQNIRKAFANFKVHVAFADHLMIIRQWAHGNGMVDPDKMLSCFRN